MRAHNLIQGSLEVWILIMFMVDLPNAKAEDTDWAMSPTSPSNAVGHSFANFQPSKGMHVLEHGCVHMANLELWHSPVPSNQFRIK